MPDAFKFYAKQVTSSNAVTIVSGVTGTRIINAINLANTSTANTASVSVQVFAGTNAFTLVPRHTMATSSSSQVLPAPISLTTADDIKAAATSGAVDVIVSALERTA